MMGVGLRKTPEKLMSCQVFVCYACVHTLLPFRNLAAASPHYNVFDSGVATMTPGKEL